MLLLVSPGQFRSAIQISAVLKTTSPGKDGGDWVGGGLVALLVFTVMPGHCAMGRLRLDGLAVRTHEHGSHQAERTCKI